MGGVSARWYRQLEPPARGERGRHHVVGGYADGGAGGAGRPKWRSVSLQGCPREVRLLLAGPYYFDVDMVSEQPAQRGASVGATRHGARDELAGAEQALLGA